MKMNISHNLISKFNAEIKHQKDLLESKINELDEACMDTEIEREQLDMLTELLTTTQPIEERLEIMTR